MEQSALFFSLLFFAAFAVYLFFGIYAIHINPRETLNRLFFAVCLSLCFWSLGFAIANSAPNAETCLFWRRVSAIGWGSAYSLLLHYLLLLSDSGIVRRLRRFLPLLYLPAIVSVFVFALSPGIAPAQYNLVRMDNGWVNMTVRNSWTVFFHAYYAGYVLACLGVVRQWGRRTSARSVRKQANILFASIAAALLLGSLTDVVLNNALKGALPQMAPVFVLIPVLTIYYAVKRYGLMAPENEHDSILSDKTLSRLYLYLSLAYFAGGFATASAYFLPHMVQSEASMRSMLYTSALLFLMGVITLLSQLLRNKKVKEAVILTAMLCSIPLITFQFIDYASITVWVFPLILILVSLLFSTRVPLLLLTAVAVITQLLVWMNAPDGAVRLDRIDHIVRVSIFLIAFSVGSFVNQTYIRRLRENTHQIDFQKLISKISFDFVSVSQSNIDEKIGLMLDRIGRFFRADRAYICLVDHRSGTMTCTHEWCGEGIPSRADGLRAVPLHAFPWWMEQAHSNKLICVEDVGLLPEQASAEREQLTRQGVRSAVIIPVEEDGRVLGFMGLDSVSSQRRWSDYHIELMRILSNLLADALIRIESEKEIKYMAYYDHLTGLPNRILFTDRLTQAIYLAQRNDRFIGVVFLDLDSFKTVNDTMGHRGGDDILREVAEGLVRRLRKSDTVARFGGDEFLIMANNLADDESIIKITDNIMEMFAHPFNVNGQDFFITGSAGVAVYPRDGGDAETLIKNADIAMYIAKSRGKNQYVLCTAGMREAVKKNIKLSNNLYRVQDRGELIVYYQPQIRLNTGKIVGLEALLRWDHPEMGMIPPHVFIPLAEMNGTINGIGDWVLKTAVHQNKKWQDMGLQHLRVAVNLSIIQLNNPQFVGNVDRILAESSLNPKYLELEITESIATKEAVHIVETLNRLKELGVSISIDDFGTEYSSLNRLKVLPIDRLKIDMQFVQGIEGSEKDQVITKVIINLAKSLGLEVLAEGVETAPQLEFLNRKMCDDVQGFYYYKPMPAEEVEKLLVTESLDWPDAGVIA